MLATLGFRRSAERSRPTTSTSSICPVSTASTCRTGPTATPADEARCWPRSSSATAARLPGRHLGRAARLPADGAGVRGDRRPGRWEPHCCSEYRSSVELLRLALVETRHAVRRRADRRVQHAARRLTRRPQGRAWRWRRPALRRRSVGLEPKDPRLPSAWEVRDECPALGRAAVRHDGDPGRRPHLALPLRPVRVDHPLLPALRVAAAADRLAAVPLRDPRRDRRPRRRAGDPEVVDRGGRNHRGHLPLQRAARRGTSPASARWSGS